MPKVKIQDVPTETERYTVDDKSFVWHSTDGVDVNIPLKIKTKTLRAMRGVQGDEFDIAFGLIDSLLDDQGREAVDEMDALETADMVQKFQEEWLARKGASLGESRGSST